MHGEVARRHEPVAVRRGAGGQPERRHRKHLVAAHRDQPARRTNELHGRRAVFELVAHDLRDRQRREGFLERGLQGDQQALPGLHRLQEHRIGLAVALDHQAVGPVVRSHRDAGHVSAAQRLELLHERVRPVRSGVARHGERHQLLPERLVGRSIQHVRDVHREPARSAEGRDDAVVRQELAVAQSLGQAGCKGLGQALQRLRRKLFGVQFDEERLLHMAALAKTARDSSLGRPGALMPPPSSSPARASGNRAARAIRSSSARSRATACGCGRCRPRAR